MKIEVRQYMKLLNSKIVLYILYMAGLNSYVVLSRLLIFNILVTSLPYQVPARLETIR